MIKTHNKLGTEGVFLNLIMGIYEKDTANIILNNERVKSGFPGGAVVKNPSANAGDVGSSPGL